MSLQRNQNKAEASEKRGTSSFYPEGRTYSPPRRHKLHILRPAANGRSHPFHCASSPHKIYDFAGTPFGGGMPAATCALRGGCGSCGSLQTMPQYTCCHCLHGGYLVCSRSNADIHRLRKPAAGSFIAVMDRALCLSIFFFKK